MQIIISVDLVVPIGPSSCSFSINIQLSLPEFLVVRLTEFLVVRLSSLWRLQFICPFSYYNNTNDFVTDFATMCVYLATIYTYILYYIIFTYTLYVCKPQIDIPTNVKSPLPFWFKLLISFRLSLLMWSMFICTGALAKVGSNRL